MRSSYQDGRVGIPLTGLTVPHFYAYLKPVPGFSTSTHDLFFVYSGLMWEMIVHFVDIDGIVYIHSLDFLFNTLAADFNCNA